MLHGLICEMSPSLYILKLSSLSHLPMLFSIPFLMLVYGYVLASICYRRGKLRLTAAEPTCTQVFEVSYLSDWPKKWRHLYMKH